MGLGKLDECRALKPRGGTYLMGLSFSSLWASVFGAKEQNILLLGLDAAGAAYCRDYGHE